VITFNLIFSVICTAISFYTFISVLSKSVYLDKHRMLPTIAAVVTIYNFYTMLSAFVEPAQAATLQMLEDMTLRALFFMMFFYMVILHEVAYEKVINVLYCGLMIFLEGYYFFNLGREKYLLTIDVIAILAIAIPSFVVIGFDHSRRSLRNNDEKIAFAMESTFLLFILGYAIQNVVLEDNRYVMHVVCAVACIVYSYLIRTNQIEYAKAMLAGAMYDLMQHPIALLDPNFYYMDSNAICQKLFPNGKGLRFAFEDGTISSKATLVETMVRRGMLEREIYSNDDWYKLQVIPYSEKNRTRGYILHLTDITKQHNEVVEAKEETASKSLFLAQMSHELRSPLHAIIGVSDLLLSKRDISAKNRGLINHVKRASAGQLSLVDAILDYSKIEAGKFTFAEKSYSLDAMLEELAYTSIINIQSKPVDFSIDLTGSIPKRIMGDETRVKGIFANLIGNAVKFTKEGYVHVTVHGEIEKDGRLHIMFSVHDSGDGMTPEQLETVFEQYVTLSDGTTMEGTGLGLCITAEVVKLLGGNIKSESDEGVGTVMSGDFYQKVDGSDLIPAKVYNRRTVMQKSANWSNAIRPKYVYPKAKVLIADDMKINYEILSTALLPWGISADYAIDGRDAVAKAGEEDYQMIFLDQMMGVMTGDEACKKIKQYTDAPIILVTANNDDELRKNFKDLGYAEFLGKPLKSNQLQGIVETYMPDAYKEIPQQDAVDALSRRDLSGLRAYQRTLETFVKEMEPLIQDLSRLEKEDRETFCVKVHGLKGVSRQIGRETFSELAEIMEMAAKAEHWDYVDKHMEDFLESLCDLVEDVHSELIQIAPEYDDPMDLAGADDARMVESKDIYSIFEELLGAFENYNINKIEDALFRLRSIKLDDEKLQVYEDVLAAYEELEYDEGAETIRAFLQKENND